MSALTLSPVGTELLDDPSADPSAVQLSLRNIARANRWFGGLAAVRSGLNSLLPFPTSNVTLLDVGTGSGDIPIMARAWARRQGLALRPLGLERHPAAAQLAASTGLTMILGCGGSLPLASKSVDVVVVSQVAHHLDRESFIALVGECVRVARHGVVLSDLRRSWLAARAWRPVGWILRFDEYTIVDGITSLRRGYTRSELGALLHASGVSTTVALLRGVRLVAAWRVGS